MNIDISNVAYCGLLGVHFQSPRRNFGVGSMRNAPWIQRRGTKFILGQNDISYEDRLKCLNMLSLEKRCYLFDVVFLYKALNGYLNIELTPLLNFYSQADPYKLRHVDDYSLKLNYARTTKFKNSYFNRIVEMWNSLPLEIRLAPNLEAFKSNVKKFLL